MINAIINNPYRILGVYSNSSKKDIVANKGRSMAFLKVNRPIEFPLDLKGVLPQLTRTLDTINEAEAHLAIVKEQIKYAQFWFVKITPIDDIAFNHLMAGNLDDAIEIWSKQESVSSLQNKIVCYLMEDKPGLALQTAERLYEQFGDSYICKIDANSTLKMTSIELFHQFINSLGKEVSLQTLLSYDLKYDTKVYIKSLAVEPLINKISSEVEKAKKVEHKNANARLDAANKLISNTKEDYDQLRSLLSSSDPQFQMIADKLGLEVLQCGIDYFNNSEDDDRHRNAMIVQKYAQSIVVGPLAKQRCEENIKILQELIDKLPPENVLNEYNHLKQIIAIFLLLPSNVDAILKLLKDTCDDLISIKEKLGKEHPFYRQQCTLIAQLALGKSVETLNKVQEIEFPKLKGLDRFAAINTIKHAFAVSWETMLWIELMETDPEFKDNRLIPNRNALLKILDSVDAFNSPIIFATGGSRSVFEGCARKVKVDPYIYYTEKELFSACSTLNVCNIYIKRFPEGEHIIEVSDRIQQIKDDNKFNSAKTINDYKDYISAYPHGRHVDEAKQRIEFLLEEQRKKREKEINDLLAKIDNFNNLNACFGLIESCRKYDSVPLMAKLDDKFFSLCRDSDDYKLYIASFRENARHIDEAREIIRKNRRRNILLVLFLALTIISAIGLSILYKIKEDERAFNKRQELIYRQYENLLLTSDVDSCIVFLKNFPDCNDSIRKSVQAALSGSLILKADSLIKNYNDDISSLQDFIDEYRDVAGINTDEAIDKVAEELTDARERRRKQAEYDKYGTDSNAWRTATSANTIDAYNDYLRRYPRGAHRNEANKKIIDLEVQSVINSGDYGYLPSSQKTSYERGINSTVKIYNRCNRTITIMYSGKKSVKIEIAPSETRNIVLPSGSYNVVAKAPGVRSFYGTENLTGGTYESEYYIQTTRY